MTSVILFSLWQCCTFLYLKWVYKKDENRCFSGNNSFKVKKAWFRLGIRKNFLTEDGGTLAQVAQRDGCPIPRNIQDQVECGSVQPDGNEVGPCSLQES